MEEISTQELRQLIEKGERFTLLDCRGSDYYNWEHLPGAINLRWKYVEEKAEKILPDKNALIITSCDGFTCGASTRCYEKLQKLGYKNLREYASGIADWKAHGFKTEEVYQYKIAPNVYRFPDQVFYGEEVGSYLIDTPDFILLIDGPQQLTEEHEDFLLHFGRPMKVFMTHDATAGDAKILQQKYKAKIYLHKLDQKGEWLTVKPDTLFEDGFTFNGHLQVIHTPGHTLGSSTLYDLQNKILFTGDTLEGTKNGEIYDYFRQSGSAREDLAKRVKSVQKLFTYDFDMILPFHYEMIRGDAKEVLNNFIKKYENNHH